MVMVACSVLMIKALITNGKKDWWMGTSQQHAPHHGRILGG
jgi:hypothetical protein